MGARSQLNGAHLTGCLIAALAVALLGGSFTLGLYTFLAQAIIGFVAGHIRPTPGRR